ncbi:hypothetical protein, partial [Salmonella sp. s58078]|uniref:hypothetical protein n=1 Tax=Salmonella sp. s58078 TaxID=3159699 RepID=UPI0039800E18
VLLLNNCYELYLIPAGVISKLTHLEELCLPDNFNFSLFSFREAKDFEISRATLSELSSLTRLTNLCVFIPKVTLVPDLNFGKLVSYRIAVGEHFNEDEEYFKERNLKLEGIANHD